MQYGLGLWRKRDIPVSAKSHMALETTQKQQDFLIRYKPVWGECSVESARNLSKKKKVRNNLLAVSNLLG